MRQILFPVLFFFATSANSAVWQDRSTGIWVGNVCQTPLGWQIVPPQPIGSTCYSPGWNSYGFIANY